jgi:hypothetical protein
MAYDSLRDQIVDVAPHYVATLVILLAVLLLVRTFVGDLGFWVELLIVAVVVFAYRIAVLQLGVAPRSWEEQQR